MNKVSIGSLKSDSYINQPVYLDEKYILLSPDVAISKELIERLQKWNYQEVRTDGVPIRGDCQPGWRSSAIAIEWTEPGPTPQRSGQAACVSSGSGRTARG